MMPSRGWRLANAGAPRVYRAQCRNRSSVTRPSRTTPFPTTRPNHPRLPQWRSSSPIAIVSLPAIRHASTAPSLPSSSSTPSPASATAPATAPAPAPGPGDATSFPNLDTITLDDIDLSVVGDIANIPEKIGYLHELGLNYGWGPTSMLEWTLEHIHLYTGLPWWGAAALTAVSIRLLMLPLYIKSSDMTARSQALMSVTKPVTDRMNAAKKSGDTQALQLAYTELLATRRRAGLSMWDQMAPMLIQGIIGYCGFKLMRAMAALPVPALKTDGFLWLQDMTLTDPFLILPLAMAGTIHFLVRIGGESGAAGTEQMAPGMRNLMLWGMPGVLLIVTGYQPGLVCVWFASGGALGVAQSLALRKEGVRKFLNIAPLYKPGKDEYDTGPLQAMLGKSPWESSAARDTGPSASSGIPPNAKAGSWAYQSPNLRRNMNSTGRAASGKIIDVSPVQKSSGARSSNSSGSSPHTDPDMIQPNAPQPKKSGIFDQASSKFSALRKNFERRPLSEEEMAKKRKEDYDRRADAYEKKHYGSKGR